MTANELIVAKKNLMKLQKNLGNELARGKYKDVNKIKDLKKEIKNKKLEIGKITRTMITQM